MAQRYSVVLFVSFYYLYSVIRDNKNNNPLKLAATV